MNAGDWIAVGVVIGIPLLAVVIVIVLTKAMKWTP